MASDAAARTRPEARTAASSNDAPTSVSWPRSNPDPDRAANNTPARTGVVQPTPQALPRRSAQGSIIVSPRQKGNPILSNIKSVPWEYGDIPADYLLGLTTCALFLSLKYHRLHPEYIYTRIKGLQGKYNLRIVLVMVDIQNHEESLRELSKTSLINNVTLILCWSSAEGGRYLELFKSYENAPPTAIKQHQSSAYSDRVVEFITTPRSINKTDALSLITQFGSLRTAVNAQHEDVARIGGWGDKKVQKWCTSVREPFRSQRAARRGLSRDVTRESLPASSANSDDGEPDVSVAPPADDSIEGGGRRSASIAEEGVGIADADKRPFIRLAERVPFQQKPLVDDDEAATADALVGPAILPEKSSRPTDEVTTKKRKVEDDSLSEGLMAALSKLRKDDG